MAKYYLFIEDNDKSMFNLLGPMNDDTALSNGVSEAAMEGRSIKCVSFEVVTEVDEAKIKKTEADYLARGLIRIDAPLVKPLENPPIPK